jgi:hypothetical protein
MAVLAADGAGCCRDARQRPAAQHADAYTWRVEQTLGNEQADFEKNMASLIDTSIPHATRVGPLESQIALLQLPRGRFAAQNRC